MRRRLGAHALGQHGTKQQPTDEARPPMAPKLHDRAHPSSPEVDGDEESHERSMRNDERAAPPVQPGGEDR